MAADSGFVPSDVDDYLDRVLDDGDSVELVVRENVVEANWAKDEMNPDFMLAQVHAALAKYRPHTAAGTTVNDRRVCSIAASTPSNPSSTTRSARARRRGGPGASPLCGWASSSLLLLLTKPRRDLAVEFEFPAAEHYYYLFCVEHRAIVVVQHDMHRVRSLHHILSSGC